MTPEHILEVFQSQLHFNQDIQAQIQSVQTQITELREGQALLMSYRREQAARRDLERLAYERDMLEVNQRIEGSPTQVMTHYDNEKKLKIAEM